MIKWLLSMLAGAAGGYLAARLGARQELEAFRRELSRRDGQPVAPPVAEPPAPLEPPPAEEPVPTEEEVDEHTAMIMAAAVAAFLGKRARVQKIRVVGHRTGDPWAMHGRVNIHASHNVVHAHSTR